MQHLLSFIILFLVGVLVYKFARKYNKITKKFEEKIANLESKIDKNTANSKEKEIWKKWSKSKYIIPITLLFFYVCMRTAESNNNEYGIIAYIIAIVIILYLVKIYKQME